MKKTIRLLIAISISILIIYARARATDEAFTTTADVDLLNKKEIKAAMQITKDEFRNRLFVQAPWIKRANYTTLIMTMLVGRKSPESRATCIYVLISDRHPREDRTTFRDAAAKGKTFPIEVISEDTTKCGKTTTDCTFNTQLTILISTEQVKRAIDGTTRKAVFGIIDNFGKNWIVELTQEYIEAFQEVFSQATQEQATTTAIQ